MTGSVVFVHGTGVRLKAYQSDLGRVTEQLRDANIDRTLVPCGWGDPFGGDFEGQSLPDAPDGTTQEQRAQELARWTWLFEDPLAELEMLSIRGAPDAPAGPPGRRPAWMALLDRIRGYAPGEEAEILLRRACVDDLWAAAFRAILGAPIVQEAFKRSEEANELADAGYAFARAVAAQLHVDVRDRKREPPSAAIRERLVQRLSMDWGCNVFARGNLIANFCKRIGTKAIRRRRNGMNNAVSGFVGDILLYQSRGQEIRDFIATKIRSAMPPVAVFAHSLGGIACVDLLAMTRLPEVDCLVTVGSQAPFFFEVEALASVRRPGALPNFFPPWLNIFDRNDFLSFVGGRLFPDKVEDEEISSDDPFPEAHSAYLNNKEVWRRVAKFLPK